MIRGTVLITVFPALIAEPCVVRRERCRDDARISSAQLRAILELSPQARQAIISLAAATARDDARRQRGEHDRPAELPAAGARDPETRPRLVTGRPWTWPARSAVPWMKHKRWPARAAAPWPRAEPPTRRRGCSRRGRSSIGSGRPRRAAFPPNWTSLPAQGRSCQGDDFGAQRTSDQGRSRQPSRRDLAAQNVRATTPSSR
jgi:hypothetical protein